VVLLNTWQQHRIARLVVQRLFGTVTGKRIAILGFAFKADTNDTREAPAIRICRDLLEEGAQLAIHDPKVDPEQISRDLNLIASHAPEADAGPTRGALSGEATWWPSPDVASAMRGADAVLILTEWQQYRELDWAVLAPLMRKPAWVFDARGVAEPKQIASAGLNFWRVGEGDA
jgi:UDPglucose 6-dehydrogenase